MYLPVLCIGKRWKKLVPGSLVFAHVMTEAWGYRSVETFGLSVGFADGMGLSSFAGYGEYDTKSSGIRPRIGNSYPIEW